MSILPAFFISLSFFIGAFILVLAVRSELRRIIANQQRQLDDLKRELEEMKGKG
jgi:uncharacterized membrane-anchored protein YhcB (DUF1043 family)